PHQIPPPIPATLDMTIKDLKWDMLVLKNDMNQIRTEVEWKSETRSGD
ncbi:11039_t:CDS:1, partial [Diversispora eburnea]